MKGIPVSAGELPQTATDFGAFQRAPGMGSVDVSLGANIQAASFAPRISPGIAASEAEAGQAIGATIKGAGDAMTRLLQERANANNQLREAHAKETMDLANEELAAAYKKEPDPMKWKAILANKLPVIEKQILTDDLSAVAKGAIRQRFDLWTKRATTMETISSAEEVITRRNDKALAGALKVGGNEGRRIIGDLEATGGISAMQAEQWRQDLTRKEEQDARKAEADRYESSQNTVVGIAAEKGEGEALKALDGMTNLTPTDKEKLRNAAQGVARDRTSGAISGIVEQMAGGKVTSEAQLNAAIGNNPHLSETAKKSLLDTMNRFDSVAAGQDAEKNGIKNFVDLRARVRDMQKPADAAEADKL